MTDLDLIASLGHSIRRHLGLAESHDVPTFLPEALRPFYLGIDNDVMTFILDADTAEQLGAVARLLSTVGYDLDRRPEREDGLTFYNAAPA
jgi:hypothetical protein